MDPPTPPPARQWYSRGYLPHFDAPRVAQLVTFRLDDSVPARLQRAYAAVQAGVRSAAQLDRARQRVFDHAEKYLGKGRGSCRLGDPRAGRIVEDSLLFGEGREYELLAWVVMPNHVHVVVKPHDGTTLERMTRRWKSWCAHELHRVFGTRGRVWEPEVFDRRIRDPIHEGYAIRYVEMNPVNAGLCRNPLEWPFTSAHRRRAEWEKGILLEP
jgi:REP element-mobilizing transposase RayT